MAPLRTEPRVALAFVAATALAAPARAADTSAFFAGKTVRILVGFSAGGGYDVYARELGRYLGRHIPGDPAIVVQNMVGADFLAAMRSQTLEVRPVGGAEVQKLMGEIYASPPDVVKLARDILVDTP